MKLLVYIFRILPLVVFSCFTSPTGAQTEDQILIVEPKIRDSFSQFEQITNDLKASLYLKFNITPGANQGTLFDTWDIMTPEGRVSEMKDRDKMFVVVPNLQLIGNKLRVGISLSKYEDDNLNQVLEDKEEFSTVMGEHERYKTWLNGVLDNIAAYIETGEAKKDLILLKLTFRNHSSLEEFDFDTDELESYAINIPKIMMDYAKSSEQDSIILKLSKKFNYQYFEEKDNSFQNMVYGEISILSNDTISVKIKGFLNSSPIKPKTTKKSIEIYSLSEEAKRLADNIFRTINENLDKNDTNN